MEDSVTIDNDYRILMVLRDTYWLLQDIYTNGVFRKLGMYFTAGGSVMTEISRLLHRNGGDDVTYTQNSLVALTTAHNCFDSLISRSDQLSITMSEKKIIEKCKVIAPVLNDVIFYLQGKFTQEVPKD